jgi:hypothetical protein
LERRLNLSLSIGIANGMGDKGDPKNPTETLHLRGDLCLRARAMGYQDTGVVNDTGWTRAVHELKRLIEKDPGLEPGEGRVILDKELPGVTQDQSRTLGLHLFFTQQHPMRGRIMLHLLARTKRIGSGSALFRILPQIELLHDPGQRAVGNAPAVFVLEDLLNPDHIALRAAEELTEDGE